MLLAPKVLRLRVGAATCADFVHPAADDASGREAYSLTKGEHIAVDLTVQLHAEHCMLHDYAPAMRMRTIQSMIMSLANKAFENSIAPIAVALAIVPSVARAQESQPAWVATDLAALIRACGIPASQLSLRWDAAAKTLQVATSPTLNEAQKRCVAGNLKYTPVKIEGLPIVPEHLTRANK